MSSITPRQPEPKMGAGFGVGISMTEAEYFEREEMAEERSEYRDGKAYIMAVGTEDHATLIITVGSLLRAGTRGKGCRVGTDQRIRADGKLYYPDVVATCGERVFDAFSPTTLLTPTVLVEVLSESTETVDRGRKLQHYRAVPSVTTYLLVAQSYLRVEQYERGADGKWIYTDFSEKSDVVELPGIGCRLALAEIYEDLDIWDNEMPGDDDPPRGDDIEGSEG